MPTSNLVQLLEAGESGDTSSRRQVETFLAGGTIAAGDWVSFDTSQSGADKALFVIEAAGVATVGNPNVAGVALEAATAGQQVRVVVAGYVGVASVSGSVVAGSPLIGPIGTAGRAEIEVPGTTTGGLVGIALAADVANFAPVMVYKRF